MRVMRITRTHYSANEIIECDANYIMNARQEQGYRGMLSVLIIHEH